MHGPEVLSWFNCKRNLIEKADFGFNTRTQLNTLQHTTTHCNTLQRTAAH